MISAEEQKKFFRQMLERDVNLTPVKSSEGTVRITYSYKEEDGIKIAIAKIATAVNVIHRMASTTGFLAECHVFELPYDPKGRYLAWAFVRTGTPMTDEMCRTVETFVPGVHVALREQPELIL